MALTWEQHQQNIFGGESGGDYDALFGYQNRPNGAFSNVKVSDMSLAQVLDFTNPRGAYGQYVAKNRPDPEMGVATPVGAYQVVGSTLRKAVDALGLDPNQKFDKATQDKIGQYILKTQGTGAWEGYGKGGASMQNKPAQMAQQQPQPNAQGFLGGLLGGQGIGGALGLSDDMRDKLRMGILAGSDPRAFAQQIQAAQQSIASRRKQREAQAGRNATADYLDKMGQTDLANLVRLGGVDGASALTLATAKPKTSEAERKIERLMAGGLDRNTAVAIVDGRYVVSRDPVTQRVTIVDKGTGQPVKFASEAAADAAEAPEVAETPEVSADNRFEDLPVGQAGGVSGWAASIANTVSDAVGAGQAFPKIGEAQAAMEDLSKRTILMLDADFAGKPSNFTREIVSELTVKPSELSQGATKSYQKTLNMISALEEAITGARSAINNPTQYSPQKVREAESSVNKLQGLLDDYTSLKNAFERKGAASQGASGGQTAVTQTDQDRALIQKHLEPNYIRDNMLPSPE